ncbi:MAG: sulfotransferase [Calditrichaeota bacterium]|nr:sulfotransferase [Calditrichota bacterium]
MDSSWFKNRLKHKLLEKANFKRIHIVGCARSGTTLLYFALSGFRNTLLYEREVSVWNWPGLKKTFQLVQEKGFQKERFFIITKRNATWYVQEKLERLIQYVNHFRIGLIYLVRDPRDVLTSKHKLHEKPYYVGFETWKQSVSAGEYLQERLKGYSELLVLRYEDLVQHIDQVEERLKNTFGLQLKPGVASLGHLEQYLDEQARNSKMVQYMHRLRNFDPRSINKWKNDPEKRNYLKTIWDDPAKRSELETFMKKYGYSFQPFETEGQYHEK